MGWRCSPGPSSQPADPCSLPDSPDKPVVGFSCHRYWTRNKILYTWVSPFHFRWLWVCFSVSFNAFTSVPILGHFLLQFPWFPCYHQLTNWIVSPNMKHIMLYLSVFPHYKDMILFPTSNFITFLPERLYCGLQSHDSNDCLSKKSLSEDQRM